MKTEIDKIMVINNHIPKCPYCNYEDSDWWDGTEMHYDGDTQIADCSECGKKYNVGMNVTYDFDTWEIKEKNNDR